MIRHFDFDPSFGINARHQSIFTRRDTLEKRAVEADTNVILAVTEERQIAGFGVFGPPAIDDRWSQMQPGVIMEIEVVVPEEFMGDVNGDLNSRRGRIMGMEPAGPGRQKIRAQVPEAEVLRYSTDLRSMTGGRGSYSQTFGHYEEMPEHAAQQVIAAYEKEKAADD